MATDTVMDVLSSLRIQSDEELATQFYNMEDLFERKLWHQLTVALVKLYQDQRSAPLQIPLFLRFINRFQGHIQRLAYVSLAITASKQCASPKEALEFLQPVAAKVDSEETRAAHVYAQLRLASIYLELKDQASAKKIIDTSRRLIDELQIADPVILACMYGTACEYYKTRHDYTQYYRNALLYLACINLDDLPEQDQQQKAYDLALAALLGDSIYNFGELILHPILVKLENTEYEWLRNVVLAVNAGNISGFQSLRPAIAHTPLLQAAMPFLEQKICLMALCECVFKRPPTDRTLSFAAVARETHLQAGARVEVLVMKAFSIGLLNGHIDQVAQTITVNWLQPRILSKEQVEQTRANLITWDNEVEQLGKWMHKEGRNIWSIA